MLHPSHPWTSRPYHREQRDWVKGRAWVPDKLLNPCGKGQLPTRLLCYSPRGCLLSVPQAHSMGNSTWDKQVDGNKAVDNIKQCPCDDGSPPSGQKHSHYRRSPWDSMPSPQEHGVESGSYPQISHCRCPHPNPMWGLTRPW